MRNPDEDDSEYFLWYDDAIASTPKSILIGDTLTNVIHSELREIYERAFGHIEVATPEVEKLHDEQEKQA